jgi:hypothetical protein
MDQSAAVSFLSAEASSTLVLVWMTLAGARCLWRTCDTMFSVPCGVSYVGGVWGLSLVFLVLFQSAPCGV